MTALPCHLCGYDLRAHPHEGKCPECGASVAESRLLAAIPRRPAWHNTDPRWRRRMLAGIWVLVLLPLMNVLTSFGWTSSIPVPTVFHFQGAITTLNDTLLCWPGVYEALIFCIGVVLLFSKERGRRRSRTDWTRRWGILCTYVVLLLSAAPVLFIGALVLVGVAALFLSMPLKYQPGMTQLFVNVSWAYLHYGPQPKDLAHVVLVACSSITIVLACIPLYDALRSTGPRWLATILLAPLALFALMHLAQACLYRLGVSSMTLTELFRYRVYFWPELPLDAIRRLAVGLYPGSSFIVLYYVEAAKWCIVLAIAVWLSIAQVASWGKGKKTSA